jgi:hypothetical protein
MEQKLFAKIDSFNSSNKKEFLKGNDLPALPSLKQSKADSLKGFTTEMMQIEDNVVQNSSENNSPTESIEPDIVMTEINSNGDEDIKRASRQMFDQSLDGKLEDDEAKGFFAKSYPEDYPPDWSLSPANNYQQPTSTNLDSVDSSLLPENERRISLCLPPFSREFYIATGYSKLQVPDDYLELIRVIVWHNRQRLKMGLQVLSPKELEEFLHVEMSQDFSNLGIEIDDFLSDLSNLKLIIYLALP